LRVTVVVVVVVAIAAGCDEMITGVDEGKVAANPDPAWLVSADSHYGMGVLTVVNASVLQWDWYSSDNNTVIDSFTLVKSH
jgi:hypothetical protein